MKRERLSPAYILDLRIRHADVAIKGEVLLSLLDEVEDTRKAAVKTPAAEPAKTWRCFHCDQVFTSRVDARNHFGNDENAMPACHIKAAGEFALLTALRNAEEELSRRRAEDSDLLRAMASMEADHQVALRREEEKGYARGLKDGREMTADDELRN